MDARACPCIFSTRLGVAIPEADYGRLATLADLLAYLGERRGG